ncbi:RDD family [Legionella donaldsonii]|uniref:RDD family n=1 Tax=Legionella donaldsonii TaxID=45060 RepID=A0A378J2A0_9GAMM|nr:RDD family protein [Legionella donaldsonii]STX41873.1 RDD family [Legionella donaldsonii]
MPKDEGQLHDIYVDWNQSSGSKEETEHSAVRPWTRFMARMIDNTLFTILFGWILVFLVPAFMEGINDTIFGFLSLVAWIFVETLLLITLGSTFGKWLLRIQIIPNDGQRPTLPHAFKRSVKVWFFGLAMGIPFINLFTLISAHSNLSKNRITSWDKAEKFTINHGEINIYRGIAAWVIIITPIAFAIMAREFS